MSIDFSARASEEWGALFMQWLANEGLVAYQINLLSRLHQSMNKENPLAHFLDLSLKQICDYLALNTHWYISSNIRNGNKLRGRETVISICEEIGTVQYINIPGGVDLYDNVAFKRKNIQLSFVQPRPVMYHQFGKPFVPNISIMNLMMFNDQSQCRKMLEGYELV